MGARAHAGASAGTTIAAIASPPGPGARGVIRVSGPRAADVVRAVWHGASAPDLARRTLLVGRLDDGIGTQPLLLLWMPAPRSFTREDVAELHLPGSPPLLAAAFARVLAAGAVAAAPGEFTRRAFLSGRIDLTRAEGVLALVEATSASEARAARALLFGGLEGRVGRARDALLELRTLCEASLDFDADDTGHVPPAELETLAERARVAIDDALGFETARTTGDALPRIVLAGAPNAGKSSLFNAWTGTPGALVSEHAGTTRDELDARIELEGRAVRLFDTAGLLAETVPAGPDAEAQARSRSALVHADIVVWVVDATADPAVLARERAALPEVPILLAWNKTDVATAHAPPEDLSVAERISISARTGSGLDDLRAAVARALEGALAAGAEREASLRHRTALERARSELDAAVSALGAGRPLELVAEHLRQGTLALDDVSGTTTSEDVLDRIFARFCLGK